MDLRKKLCNEVLEHRKHSKISYPNYISISVRDNVRCCNIFCILFVIFADFFLMQLYWIQVQVEINAKLIILKSSASGNQCKTDNFENLRYVSLSNTDDILLDNECGPDNNFFNAIINNLNTPYILPIYFVNLFKETLSGILSIFHLNMKSIKKNFDNFKLFYQP